MLQHLLFALYLGNKPNTPAPNGVNGNSLGNNNCGGKVIPSKDNEAKHLNNVEKGEKNVEDENNSTGCCSPSSFDMRNCCQNLIARSFTKKQLNRKLPITDWLPKYNLEYFISDLIAGITVGLTVIPQGIAYALVAELPPQVSKDGNATLSLFYIIF